MQARGRAGRNGAPGSSELIVDYQSYCNENGIGAFNETLFYQSDLEKNIKHFSEEYRDQI